METAVHAWKTDSLTPGQILQVRHHLEEILAGPAFAGSRRAQDFLRLVVGHALEGDFNSLTERMIGVEMFGRPVGYDTGNDSVVRVKASEVRKKLAQHYTEAPDPAVRIELPSGSYVPKFSLRPAAAVESYDASPPSPLTLPAAPLVASAVDVPARSQLPDEASATHDLSNWPTWLVPRAHPWVWVGVLLLAMVVGLGARLWYVGWNAPPPIRSVAVLPLENHSGVPEEQYIADGLTRELINDLGLVSKLPVAAVASVTSYRESTKPLPEIARELTVDGIVQGSIVREGSRVLIGVRLTNVKTNHIVWAHTYVRDLKTALAWQGEVAHAVAGEIDRNATPQAQARFQRNHTIDPVAQDLYLHGKYLLEAEDCTNAADYFRAALNVDFNYPQSQAALAFCDGHLGETDRIASYDAFTLQRMEAAKAVELEDSLAEGHAELANAAINLNWDWSTAGQEFRRALQLNPKSASIHEEYERYLVRTGRVRETLTEVQKSEDLDPFSSRLYHLEGVILYYCRQYDQALLLIQKVRTLDIPPPNWHFVLGEIDAEKGLYADSIAEFLRAGTRPQTLGHLGNVYARAGRIADAQAMIPLLEESVRNEGTGRYEIALVYAGLGQKTDAFKWLEEAYKAHDEGISYLKIEPCLDPLRTDPRFDDLLGRVGLAQ